jgi:hypothetical protein
MVQTNLREIDAVLDAETYVRNVKEFAVDVVLFNTGGIVANYPTSLPFHFPNPHLKGDLAGDMLERLKREGIRFLARFDFSKVNEALAAKHPEWLYVSLKGEPVNYNGQVATCVNGPYQQECSLEILGEVLARYAIDGVFFNMIGYQTHDYSGNYHGICQCDNCRLKFRAAYGLELPRREDAGNPDFRKYERFRRETSRELFWKIARFVKAKGSGLAVCTATNEGVDIYRKESNTGINRPLPEWTYSATDNVKSVLASWPGMAAANTAVHFIDFPYRHSAVSPHLTCARLAGDLISGGWIDYYVIGTLEGQDDRLCFGGAKEIYRFHRENEQWLGDTDSEAEICLIAPESSRMHGSMAEYRGIYRILAEGHFLFDVCADSVLGSAEAESRLKRYPAVVLPDVRNLGESAVAALDSYVAGGGRLLATGAPASGDEDGEPKDPARLKSLGVAAVARRHPRAPGAYFRIFPRDKQKLAGFEDLDILYLDSELLESRLNPGCETLLGYIAPVMYGPPEKCFLGEPTSVPGMIRRGHKAGRCTYIPWAPGRQYVRLSHPGHATLVQSALQDLLGSERRMEISASPLVEVTCHRQREGRWRWMGLLNHSGQLGTAFHAPLPIEGIRIRLKSAERPVQVRALHAGANLEFSASGGWLQFILPSLSLFEVILIRARD